MPGGNTQLQIFDGGDSAYNYVKVINKDYLSCHCEVSYEHLGESRSPWNSAGCSVKGKGKTY